jgi:hypothetical protein
MRKIILTLFIFNVGLLFSHTKLPDLKINLLENPLFEKITLTINSESDSITNITVQIIDSENKVLKTVALPNSSNYLESIIDIHDLFVGKYSCVVLKEKKELDRIEFVKDIIDFVPVKSSNSHQPEKKPQVREHNYNIKEIESLMKHKSK